MSLLEFIQSIQEMRRAQRAYFASRSQEDLIRAKQAEKKVDMFLELTEDFMPRLVKRLQDLENNWVEETHLIWQGDEEPAVLLADIIGATRKE